MKDVKTPLEAFCYWEDKTPNSIFLSQPIIGKWRTWTYREAGLEARTVAAAIGKFNLPERSNIAILSKNCAEWILADLAIWMAGHVSVPIFSTVTSPALKKILHHSEARILFVGKLDAFETQVEGIPDATVCISIDAYGINLGLRWTDIIKMNNSFSRVRTRFRGAEELATIKYTSGTTGTPKGVMVSFGALHHAITNALTAFNLPKIGARFFSYLPLSHVAERMLVEMGGIYSGGTIFFSESLEKFPTNLRFAKPHVFVAVPRIWAKFREQIEKNVPCIRMLLNIPIVRVMIGNAIRKRLGLSQCKLTFSGAAPITVEMLEWFDKLGIVIQEVYGMTENISYSHINLECVKFGTVGRPWKDVLVKFSDQDEIQVKHKAVLMGYFREPEMTEQVFTTDGYLKTGDKGKLDEDGFLVITGRIKDQFKTAKGKFVDPMHIEEHFLSNGNIDQICVVGSGLPQPIGLLTLSYAGRKLKREDVANDISATLKIVNSKVEQHEQIKCVTILSGEWTVANGLLTPTLKIKRGAIENLYHAKYSEWYFKHPVNWE